MAESIVKWDTFGALVSHIKLHKSLTPHDLVEMELQKATFRTAPATEKVRPRARTFCYESEQNNRRESKEFGTKKARKTKMRRQLFRASSFDVRLLFCSALHTNLEQFEMLPFGAPFLPDREE